MSKNQKAWKKLLPCLALAAILLFGAAMRFPADAISPKPATIQASTGDYFNLAYEKTLEFVQPVWEKIKLFSDQPKDWNEISQNLIEYAKEKPLMAAAVGAGVIWIPFGLFRAFRSKKEEDENSEYDEFMSSEFEDEEEDDYEEDDDEEEDKDYEEDDDEEEYQKNLREFSEDEDEDKNKEAAEDKIIEEAETVEEEVLEEDLEEAALLEEDTEEEIFEDFESESLEETDDDLLFQDDENDDLLFEEDEEDEFAALRDEEELSEDDEFSDIFSDSTSDDEITDTVPAKNFTSDTDTSDDVLKKLENEFASLESEFSEVDDFIDKENKKLDSGSEKILSHEEGSSSEVDQLLSASESLSNLEDNAPKDLPSDPFEGKELPSNIMDIINKEAKDAVTPDSENIDSSTPAPKKFEIESLEDEEELDQTLKDLQAEMEQTIQEISAQIDSEPQYYSETETEDPGPETSSIENEVIEDSPFESAAIITEAKEENDESSLDEILQKAEEEAQKDLKDLLPKSNVFLEEEVSESTVEEEISDNQTIPDTVEETFKDVFAEALEGDTLVDNQQEEEVEDYDLATIETKTEAESVDDIISLIEEETSQEIDATPSVLEEEKPVELPDLVEETAESFDPLLPALDAATHEEKTPKPADKQIDSVKANSYIKSLGAFQKNLENRLNTLKYFPPMEEAKPPTPKVDEFEVVEPVIAEEPDIDFDHIGESPEKKYSLELMESFILLDNQK